MIAEIDEMLKSASTLYVCVCAEEKPYLRFSFWQASSSSNLCFLVAVTALFECCGVGGANTFCNGNIISGGVIIGININSGIRKVVY